MSPTASLSRRRPTFIGQGLLLLLPVVALAWLGVLALRQDRVLAEHEARERAQALADDLAERILRAVCTVPQAASVPGAHPFWPPVFDHPNFQLDPAGQLVFPPACEALPTPRPFDPRELTEEQAQLWNAARVAEFTAGDPTAIADLYRQFLAAELPCHFAAAARYSIGLSLARQHQPAAAFEFFDALARGGDEVLSDSGLPFAQLGAWQALQLRLATPADPMQRATWIRAFCSNQVFRPTPLSPALIRQLEPAPLEPNSTASADPLEPRLAGTSITGGVARAAAQAGPAYWLSLWQSHELARRLFARLGPRLRQPETRVQLPAPPTTPRGSSTSLDQLGANAVIKLLPGSYLPPPVWVELDEAWLVYRVPMTGPWFAGKRELEVRRVVADTLSQFRGMPAYLAVAIRLAGRALIGAPPGTPLLAVNAWTREAAALDLPPGLEVALHLADPAALYANQRTRTRWFGGLIAIAAGVALVGLAAAYRAFHRQLRLNELKSNFVSSVSHELRAPIASVRLLAESLDRGKVPDEARRQDYFRLIVQECRRLAALIENALDFSRIDQGRKEYEFEPTDLPALLRQTVSLMEPYAAARQVTLDLQLAGLGAAGEHAPLPAGPTLQPDLDGKTLQQALINLIDNAIKHSPAGQTVTVSLQGSQPDALAPSASGAAAPSGPQWQQGTSGTEGKPAPGGGPSGLPVVLTISVVDRGPGIPVADRARIFEPFYRRGSELRRETQGVGIGLSIVRHIVAAHGGRVWVEGEAGQGSCFRLELPVRSHE